jgi:hypothetical protein
MSVIYTYSQVDRYDVQNSERLVVCVILLSCIRPSPLPNAYLETAMLTSSTCFPAFSPGTFLSNASNDFAIYLSTPFTIYYLLIALKFYPSNSELQTASLKTTKK